MKASDLIRRLTVAMGGENNDFEVIAIDSFTGHESVLMDVEFNPNAFVNGPDEIGVIFIKIMRP